MHLLDVCFFVFKEIGFRKRICIGLEIILEHDFQSQTHSLVLVAAIKHKKIQQWFPDEFGLSLQRFQFLPMHTELCCKNPPPENRQKIKILGLIFSTHVVSIFIDNSCLVKQGVAGPHCQNYCHFMRLCGKFIFFALLNYTNRDGLRLKSR